MPVVVRKPTQPSSSSPQRAVQSVRLARPLHRWLGVPLTALVLLSSATGVLLAWKKNSATLQPPTQVGASTDVEAWAGLAAVRTAAVEALARQAPDAAASPLVVDRFDARPDKGVVKVRFTNHWEVQVDPVTLQALSVGKRNDVWIEQIHDLSIVSDGFKLLSMNVLGLGLVLLSGSGLWLWYGPRLIRRRRG